MIYPGDEIFMDIPVRVDRGVGRDEVWLEGTHGKVQGVIYGIKDSGVRETYDSGMVRDTAQDKIDYSLIYDGPMLRRWAIHLTNGAKKYAKRNWMRASGEPELARFRESAARHFTQWMNEERDEDHASAVVFNINGYERLKEMKVNAYKEREEGSTQARNEETEPAGHHPAQPARR